MRTPFALITLVLGMATLVQSQGKSSLLTLTDITRDAGLAFSHHNGAFGKKYLPETMGVGPAFFDVDRDGDQDLMFANGADWPEKRGSAPRTARKARRREVRRPGRGCIATMDAARSPT